MLRLIVRKLGRRPAAALPVCRGVSATLSGVHGIAEASSGAFNRHESGLFASTSQSDNSSGWSSFKGTVFGESRNGLFQQQLQVEPITVSTSLPSSKADYGTVRNFHKAPHAEVKMESQVVFDSCWRRFEDKYGQNFKTPREIVWLNGAPGSGKGVNTPHILKTRGLNRAIHISALLRSVPEANMLMDAGEMISDSMVGDLLLEAILRQSKHNEHGVIVDGFPRTAFQVDFLKLLHDKLEAIHDTYADTPWAPQFPRPSFKVVVLYVDEETSVMRQLQRAQLAKAHNKRVLDAGANCFWEERATDVSTEKCVKRYEIFKAHYSAILRLKQFFPFHLIDSMGSLQETQEQITQELRYQSSMDLNEETYAVIRHLPLAKDLVRSARQQLVTRLDSYRDRHPSLFEQVVSIITNETMPIIEQAGLAGQAEYSTSSSFFSTHPKCVDMLIDILADRGFSTSYVRSEVVVPTHFDTATGRIHSRREPVHKFRIMFDTRGVRDAFKAMEIAARVAEVGGAGMPSERISQSFIPEQMDHESRLRVAESSYPPRTVVADSEEAMMLAGS